MSNNNVVIIDKHLEQYQKTAGYEELDNSEIFELFAIDKINSNYDLSYENIQSTIVDGSMDGGIDSILMIFNDDYFIDGDIDAIKQLNFSKKSNFKIQIIQVKTERSFKEDAINRLISSIPYLFDLESDEGKLRERFNDSIVEKFSIIKKVWADTSANFGEISVHYKYVCKANEISKNKAFDSKVDQLKELTKQKIHGVKVDFTFYSAKELLDLINKSRPKKLALKFIENPICSTFDDEEIGYIGLVNLSDYYQFITEGDALIENIFESNVRHYQGPVDVNKKIRESIESELNTDFWWLNNGITIIGNESSISGKKMTIDNVQIVNGLQTSYTIGKFYKNTKLKDTEKRAILVKVITSKKRETTEKIIASTNRQNAVSPTLLRATDEIQKRIEQRFLAEGYFYDRRKNFYKNQDRPAKKIFSIQGTAQAVVAIMKRNPSTARSKPTTIVKTDNSYAEIFNDKIDFKVHLNCCLITQKAASFIKLEKDKNMKNFTYHLSRTTTSFILDKAIYDECDILNADINKIDDEILKNSYNFLNNCIKQYSIENPDENPINIAKSKIFEERLNKEINNKFVGIN